MFYNEINNKSMWYFLLFFYCFEDCCHLLTDSETAVTMAVSDAAAVATMSEEEQLLKEECEELFSHFNHRLLEAILRATRLSLDFIRKRVFFQGSAATWFV